MDLDVSPIPLRDVPIFTGGGISQGHILCLVNLSKWKYEIMIIFKEYLKIVYIKIILILMLPK